MAGLVLLALLVPAGCARGDHDASGRDPGGVEQPSAPPAAVGAIGDLGALRCAADSKDRWHARTTLTNGTDRRAEYVLTLSVIDPNNSEVFGERTVRAELAPGQTKKISVRSVARGHPTDGRCVPFVTRKMGRAEKG